MNFPERKLTLSERAYYEIKRMIAQREILPARLDAARHALGEDE